MGTGRLLGTILDAETGAPIPARLYVTASDGQRYYPTPSIQHPAKRELEGHVITLGKPFEIEVPAGRATVRIERGPEFVPITETVEIQSETTSPRKFAMRRWIDMAADGWYSGDLHVHRRLADMTALLAGEDLNVAMPLTAWDRRPRDPDLDMFAQHATPAGEVRIDDRHLFTIYNQEYEPARSPTGAVLLMGMSKLIEGADPPPLQPVFDLAHQRGGFVDMEKHSWAWAPVVAATGRCDVFELANNHHWREKCLYIDFEVPMRSLKNEYPQTIEGWTLYGFDSWYAYLNCGFHLAPAAGTANGVHPNPLGHSRVYVKLGRAAWDARSWQRGLLAGRSFVTTGPMLWLDAAGKEPGDEIKLDRPGHIAGQVRLESLSKPERLELIRGGDVVHQFSVAAAPDAAGVYRIAAPFDIPVESTTYLTARTLVEPPDRSTVRFAHTGIVRVSVPGQPLRPRRFELDHFIHRVETMIAEIRAGKLHAGDRESALAEYARALAVYQQLTKRIDG